MEAWNGAGLKAVAFLSPLLLTLANEGDKGRRQGGAPMTEAVRVRVRVRVVGW